MRYFVTGASGWIGSAVVAELIEAGHEVVGLARSDASAERVRALGADVHRGELDDLDSLVAGAAASDGVVHLGYNHDFSRMGEAAQTDLAAINAIGGALEGTDRPLLIASGTLGLATGRVATEEDSADPSSHPRIAGAQAALALAPSGACGRSWRASRRPCTAPGDPGFVAVLVAKARETGVAGYVGDGANRWPAVHRLDAARLVRLAVEGAPAGSVVHATAEEGIPTVQIAEAIGRALGIETASVAPEHFDWLGPFFAADVPASSARTRALLGWEPREPGLLEDIPSYVV